MKFDYEKFADGVHDYLARALRPLAERLKSDDARIAALAARVAVLEEQLSHLRRIEP